MIIEAASGYVVTVAHCVLQLFTYVESGPKVSDQRGAVWRHREIDHKLDD